MAADAADDFALLAATAKRSIDDLRHVVHVATGPPTRRGEHFLAVVDGALDALVAGIADREADFVSAADDAERQSVIRAMRRINYDVMSLHEITPWIEGARRSNLGLGVVYLIDEMVRTLIKSPADVVTTPSGTYMYSTIHKPFEAALTNLGIAYPAVVAPIIVAYPVHEPDSLFLHLIIAHELGHSAITEHHLDQDVYSQDPDPSGTRDQLNSAVAEFISIEGGTAAVARGKIRAMLRSWLTELLCDALAVSFLGPSFLLTAAAFSAPFGGPEPSDTHPPLTLRSRRLLSQLEASGWRPLIEAAIPATFKWLQDSSQQPQQAGRRTYFMKLEDVIAKLSDTIDQVITAHVGADRFEPDTYATCSGELEALLARDILPAQLLDRTAPACRSIVLAGWMHAFVKHGDAPVALASIVGDRNQQRFLTKALEMSVMLARWGSL